MVQLRSGSFSKPASLRERIERVCIQFKDTFPLYGTPLDDQGHGNVHRESKRSITDDGVTPGSKYDGRNEQKDKHNRRYSLQSDQKARECQTTYQSPRTWVRMCQCANSPGKGTMETSRHAPYLMRLKEGNVQPFFQPRAVF